ncbi:MAG: type III pantothenate kinase, partial [Elusimicrobiota bacterium]|nr:type III pantothenate kinase [Elusimicrobiota bacterium]
MLLVFDIGNTNITVGLFDNDVNQKSARKVWRISSLLHKTTDEYGITLLDMFHYSGLDAGAVKFCAAASVVPSLNPAFAELAKRYFGCEMFFINS